ncbi:MAG: glycosyltransferase, partial [Minisyncoccia bacterium]
MRILIIRATNAIGGAEIYNLNLIKAFRKYYSEDKLIFITTLPEFSRRIKEEGVKAITLSVFSEEVGTKRGLLRFAKSFPRYFLRYLRTIFVLARREKVDLICIQSATEKIFLTSILKLLGFRVVWLDHGPFFSFKPTREVMYLYKLSSYFSDKIIAVSQNTLHDAQNGGINKEKLICIYTGIDTNRFRALSKRALID